MNNFSLELEHPYKQQNNIISPLGLNFITNEYTNFPLSFQWGMASENLINFEFPMGNGKWET